MSREGTERMLKIIMIIINVSYLLRLKIERVPKGTERMPKEIIKECKLFVQTKN